MASLIMIMKSNLLIKLYQVIHQGGFLVYEYSKNSENFPFVGDTFSKNKVST